MLVTYLAYSSVLKKQATFHSQISLDYQWIAVRFLTEDGALLNQRCSLALVIVSVNDILARYFSLV
jgi:hypothetical protein